MDTDTMMEIMRCFSKEEAAEIIRLIILGASVDSAIQYVITNE